MKWYTIVSKGQCVDFWLRISSHKKVLVHATESDGRIYIFGDQEPHGASGIKFEPSEKQLEVLRFIETKPSTISGPRELRYYEFVVRAGQRLKIYGECVQEDENQKLIIRAPRENGNKKTKCSFIHGICCLLPTKIKGFLIYLDEHEHTHAKDEMDELNRDFAYEEYGLDPNIGESVRTFSILYGEQFRFVPGFCCTLTIYLILINGVILSFIFARVYLRVIFLVLLLFWTIIHCCYRTNYTRDRKEYFIKNHPVSTYPESGKFVVLEGIVEEYRDQYLYSLMSEERCVMFVDRIDEFLSDPNLY